MDKGLLMFEVDTDYVVLPSGNLIYMCQTVPARNVSEAIDAVIINLSRDQTRRVNVQRIQITTTRK